jgi:hypothetical protein
MNPEETIAEQTARNSLRRKELECVDGINLCDDANERLLKEGTK